jgi:hypothetical protein
MDTESSRILDPEFYTPSGTQTHLFHQVESFFAQNGKDRVHLGDFVIFCYRTRSGNESAPSVSKMYSGIDTH